MLLAFPLVFTTIVTDPFILPKQIVIAAVSVLSIVVLSIRMIVEGRIRLRTTPFDLPVLLFGLIVFLSAMFSANRYDALIAFVPLFFVILLFFILTNVVRGQKAILFSVSSLLLGSTVAALLAVLSFFKIYVLPLTYSHIPAFTPFGSVLDQAIF